MSTAVRTGAPWVRDLSFAFVVAIAAAAAGSAALWAYGWAVGIWAVTVLLTALGDNPAYYPWWSTDTGIAWVTRGVFAAQIVGTTLLLWGVTRRRRPVVAGVALGAALVLAQVRYIGAMEAESERQLQERAAADAKRAAEADAARAEEEEEAKRERQAEWDRQEADAAAGKAPPTPTTEEERLLQKLRESAR